MKGVFIQQQVEYRLEVANDSIVQGDVLPCVLTLKNHSAAPVILADIGAELVFGKLKELSAQEGAIEVIDKAGIDSAWELKPGESKSASWSMTLDRNCPVSDRNSSLAFRFGNLSGPVTPVPISVKPHATIQGISELLESSFQFVRKADKWAKGWTEIKFKPPSAKKFSMLNELNLGFHFEGQSLILRFGFNVKKFDPGDAASMVKVGKGKSCVEKILEENQYLLSGGYLNHSSLEVIIGEALDTVATGF